MAAADDEGRDRADAHFPTVGVALANAFQIFVALHQAGDDRSIHSSAICDVSQHFDIADIATFFEIGSKERIDDCVLFAFNTSPMDQTWALTVFGVR